MRFFIYAPSYNKNSGGSIVLHRLVHLINNYTKHEAYLTPRKIEKFDLSSIKKTLGTVKRLYFSKKESLTFKVNTEWNTPVVYNIEKKDLDNAIVIYPESTFGNPLKAKNIVRWFLHQPGHFSKEINYGLGELYFKFNTAIKDFTLYGSKLSKVELKVIYYPIEYYNLNNEIKNRNGACYTIRKGKHKKYIHDENAICIDGLGHKEISEIFKKTEIFISYDDYTAYSIFAVLCGCKSFVVPDENISINEWYPNEEDRYGISYGNSEEQIIWSERTKSKVSDRIEKEHKASLDNIYLFIREVDNYFKK